MINKKNNFSVTNIFRVNVFFISFIFTLQSMAQTTEVKEILKNSNFKKEYQSKNSNKNISKVINIDKAQESAVSSNSIYFVNKKIISANALRAIPKSAINSVKVVKRDTIVDKKKFDTQIFVETTITHNK